MTSNQGKNRPPLLLLMDKNIGDAISLAVELVLPALVLALIGYYVDKHFGLTHVGMIVGLFGGAGIGFYSVIRKFLSNGENKGTRKG